jgi:hypothetical protein
MRLWFADTTRMFLMAHGQPGLDHRHRDRTGEISRKHGNTTVFTLRQTYGPDFAPGIDDHKKLAEVLLIMDEPSLSTLCRLCHS